jgi:UDP-N-acetyl-D-glucosamine dehydrogenase
VNGSAVLILGVAYKRDIDDARESPALDVIRLLESHGAVVSYHDPYIASVSTDADVHANPAGRQPPTRRHSVPLTPETLAAADAVVIITDHRSVDYQAVVDHASLVVDSRNATAALRPGRASILALTGPIKAGSRS